MLTRRDFMLGSGALAVAVSLPPMRSMASLPAWLPFE